MKNAEEQGSRGAEGQGGRYYFSSAPPLPCSPASFIPHPSSFRDFLIRAMLKSFLMLKPKNLFALLALATIFVSACSKTETPGSWSVMDTGTSDAFYSVNFVDENNGWLNGHTDRSYIPSAEEIANANANKNAKPKNPKDKIDDPLKANQGFEVLHSTDGGKSWKQIPDQFKYKIRSVWFVDPQTGWALTIDRDILHTTDGGGSWALQRKAGATKLKLRDARGERITDVPEQIDQIFFLDTARGWAWGGGRKDSYSEQPGIFISTVDGGGNWNEVPYPFDSDISAIFFLNANRAWASVKSGFYATADGGLNWAKVQTRLPEDLFYSIFFLDESNGWVVGRSGRMAKTADGGATWTRITRDMVRVEFVMRDIHFTDRDHGWAAGEKGAILYTDDGGENWESIPSPFPEQFTDVFFVNRRAGWIAGLNGAALRFEPAD
jgi:photosystem II stability/assembly factor-like uncharacterized protein